MMLQLGEGIPYPCQIQHESLDRPFSRHQGCPIEHLGLQARTVDLDFSSLGIDQPRQLRTVGQPLSHLFPERTNPIRLRTQFDYEVGTCRPVPAEYRWIEALDTLPENPGSIGRPSCTVGQCPSGRGVKSDPSFVAFSPVAKLTADLVVPCPSQSVSFAALCIKIERNRAYKLSFSLSITQRMKTAWKGFRDYSGKS